MSVEMGFLDSNMIPLKKDVHRVHKGFPKALKIGLAVAIGAQAITSSVQRNIFERYSEKELARMALNGEIQTSGICDEDNPPTATGECQIVDTLGK